MKRFGLRFKAKLPTDLHFKVDGVVYTQQRLFRMSGQHKLRDATRTPMMSGPEFNADQLVATASTSEPITLPDDLVAQAGALPARCSLSCA